MSNTELSRTLEKLSSISLCARGNATFQFTSLAHHLNIAFLRDCYYRLARNKAVGVDRVSWKDYGKDLEGNLEKLITELKKKTYKPLPSRRVYIGKDNKEQRPLGISALESKLVELAISRVIGSIYEVDFYGFSYGFRPKRSAHHALKRLGDSINFKPVNYIVEADIKGFFDNIDHDILMRFLEIRIKDRSLLQLMRKFLEVGYIDAGRLIETKRGTPQGSILSPMLSNIFLHYVLDEWYAQVVKQHVRGYTELIRYADDFIILVETKKDAERIHKALHNRFTKYNLALHPEKTRVFSFGRKEKQRSVVEHRKASTFDFLGFTHYCDKSRSGHFKVGRKTRAKKFRASLKALNLWLKSIRNWVQTRDWWKVLSAKIRGHYEYYGVSENYHSISMFYRRAIQLVRKWLNRRSQKKTMDWQKMERYLAHYPLPKPRIRHNFYSNTYSVN